MLNTELLLISGSLVRVQPGELFYCILTGYKGSDQAYLCSNEVEVTGGSRHESVKPLVLLLAIARWREDDRLILSS